MPEPWAIRLINESGARLLLDERDLWPDETFPTTVVIVRTEFLNRYPDLVDQWLRAHLRVTRWVREHPDEAKTIVRDEIKALTGATISDEVIAQSFMRMEVVDDPMTEAVKQSADHAYALGFLGDAPPDLTSLVDVKPLERARASAG
ncbi:MAG: transporter substrate-binding protein [Dehalococcoidia bacterium]|nr:transporter substrate-binding protein [Dehalococcoidia bacterium]